MYRKKKKREKKVDWKNMSMKSANVVDDWEGIDDTEVSVTHLLNFIMCMLL